MGEEWVKESRMTKLGAMNYSTSVKDGTKKDHKVCFKMKTLGQWKLKRK